MGPLPQPDDLASLVLRTDFKDDAAWEELRNAINAGEPRCVTFVSDRAYAGVTIAELVSADAAASDEQKLTYVFLADATAMAEEHLLLAVDLHTDPGRTFRLPPSRFAEVSTNLTIANLDFAEFADAVDNAGVYRG